tara:strand:+ start:215 stop:523 length:309 start_codon:yes stop_codon:yes gene_type:complete
MSNSLIEEDVEVPIPGMKSFIISSSVASMILSSILLLLGWDIFSLLSKWLWRAIIIGLMYLVLILAVAIRELYVKIELMKTQFGDLSLVGDLAGIQSFLKAL